MTATPAAWVARVLVVLLLFAVAGCQRTPVRPPTPDPAPHSHAPRAPAQGGGRHPSLTPPPPREGPAPWSERDRGPAVPPDVSGVQEPVPRVEPLAQYGNRSPYTVLGRTYRVLPTAKGYRERGSASWYGYKFHGRLTSSREVYDMYAMTAAHKTLPLPTYVRVTHLENGRSIIVRVNDRGPFVEGRIIDLSYAAAAKLGVHVTGTAPVEVVAIDPANPDALPPPPAAGSARPPRPVAPPPRAPAPAPAAPAMPPGSGDVHVQAGSFASRENARNLAERIERAGVDDVFVDRVLLDAGLRWRVRIGPLSRGAEAERVLARLRTLGIRGVAVTAD
jgi:rare lipoprotein A